MGEERKTGSRRDFVLRKPEGPEGGKPLSKGVKEIRYEKVETIFKVLDKRSLETDKEN